VAAVQREDPAVTLALAEERDETHGLDQQPVAREARGPGGEVVGRPVERLAGGRVVGLRMEPLDLRDQGADVAGAVTAAARCSADGADRGNEPN
jgi:hypothetical protein